MFPLHSRIRHQTNDYLFFILEFDRMITDLAKGALSVSEAMNLGFTGRESIWRVLPLPISYLLLPFFVTSCDSHMCAFVPWETAGTIPFVLLADSCFWYRHTAAFCALEASPPPGKRAHLNSTLLVSLKPRSKHNTPTEKVISCSDPAPAPLSWGHNNKSMMLLKVLPPSVVPGSHSRKQETWEWALERHFHQEHLITVTLI